MPSAVFGSVDKPSQSWRLALNSPCETRTAKRIEEVLPLLEFAEAQARSGSYVAVMISYEASPAFDSALRAYGSGGFPFAWAAVFPKASVLDRQASGSFTASPWTPTITKDEYDAAVNRIRELIAAGDTYQVNYSFPLTCLFSGDPHAWYRELSMAQGAPYSAFLDLGRYQVLSLSPELFFERKGDQVTTKPMKGTVRRGRWAGEDDELSNWLQSSAKDRAENIMIVDLLRNDLGKVSVPGSVHVSSLFEPERFETVWQMTSTVRSTLRDGTTLLELLSALFPCGSITGAPKIRTMQIIRELERFPRGAYTGTIGWLGPGGNCVFNVAIRTIVIDSQTGVATFGVGGGVTIDSTAEREYEECLVKSRCLQTKPVEFGLFESMLLEDGKIFLLERHLERLKKSATYFGFCQFDMDLIKQFPSGKWKFRMDLSKDGSVRTDVSPITNRKDPLRVALATEPVDSSDPFLFHKTTNRDFSTAQLKLRPDCDDIIFWNERGEVTESTIANVVVSIDGELLTPPVSCGLLAGTFRNQLLTEEKIKERVITIEELKNAKELFLINSVRKWMNAELIIEQDLRASSSKLL